MKGDLATVILTNYNYGDYIVDAVAGQTYRRLELIVIDDCSSDYSRELIERLGKEIDKRFERFSCLFLPENHGPNHALNLGIPLANGEITLLLDADDCLHQEYISETVEHLWAIRGKNSRIAFVYTDCILMDVRGKYSLKPESDL